MNRGELKNSAIPFELKQGMALFLGLKSCLVLINGFYEAATI